VILLPTIPVSKETVEVLNNRQWICSYSGGKDSTSLVTWIEWLRRTEMIRVEHPRLVHPGGQKMRWCTRATKIDPMKGFSKTLGPDILKLSGVRWGESGIRDKKMSSGGCSAGGECGLPEPGEGVYGPIIAWKVCKVVEWLNGECEGVSQIIPDLLPAMADLVSVYDVKRGQSGLWETPPTVSALRFGCIGCPAITKEKITNSRRGRGIISDESILNFGPHYICERTDAPD
jgi:3'-phosphoadenosine 5'-phosphosulfate sulfotransferase (PAPS reductase)/FAD synthetase